MVIGMHSKPLLSISEIDVSIQEGKKYKDTILVSAEDGSRVRGIVTSDCRRILLADNRLNDGSEGILFGIDTEGLAAGDTIEGSILLNSNCGAVSIPVRASVTDVRAGSEGKKIRTLEEFAKLCAKDMREGFHIFTKPSFAKLLIGKNKKYQALYMGLSHNPVTYQHLEEFLIACGLKEPVMLSIDKTDKGVYCLDVSQKDIIYIYKNNWGYTRMEIDVAGDFISVPKKIVTSEDFIGRLYAMEFIIHRELLGTVKKYGRIIIKTVYQTIEFEIEASSDEGLKVYKTAVRRRRIMDLMKCYMKLQLHQVDYRSWIATSRKSVSEMREEDSHDILALLYDAFLLYTDDKEQQAEKMLKPLHMGRLDLMSNLEKAIYYYLAYNLRLGIRSREETLRELYLFYRQEPVTYLYLDMILSIDPAYADMPAKVIYELEQIYEKGCISPFLYLRAFQLINAQESLLRRLSPFYVQVVRFAQKHGILSRSLLRRVAFLSTGTREFSPLIYKILTEGYEQYPGREILEAICRMLIQGEPAKEEYFKWYALAVDQELKLTRLYEYYMETAHGESGQKIPQQVRMYFAYHNTLGEKKNAFLFASVIQSEQEDPTTFSNYDKSMRSFAKASVARGRINRDYAVIYQKYLAVPHSLNEAEEICRVLFARKVTVENRSIRRVIVCHEALAEEESYILTDGVAYPRIYSEDACILFEDEKRRRFAGTISYKMETLMDAAEIAKKCLACGVENSGLVLYCCGSSKADMHINTSNLEYYIAAEKNEAFTQNYRRQIRKKLLEYYCGHRRDDSLEERIRKMDFMPYAEVDKAAALTLLIDLGLDRECEKIIGKFGYEGVAIDVLLKYTRRRILDTEFAEDEELLYLAEHVYRFHVFDEMVLRYLQDYMMTSVEELIGLWGHVKGFQLDSRLLEERILSLITFTGSTPQRIGEILKSYIMNSGKEQIINDTLEFYSSLYVLEERDTENAIFVFLEKTLIHGWKLPVICSLAYLKHAATGQKQKVDAKTETLTKKLLEDCVEKGLVFSFMTGLPGRLLQGCQLEDKIFAEARYPQDAKVSLVYQISRNPEFSDEGWKKEPLAPRYKNIYNREFLLFSGETLTYYFVAEINGVTETGEKQQIRLEAPDMDGISRYRMLNRMLACRDAGNRAGLDREAQEYLMMDAFTEKFLQNMQ